MAMATVYSPNLISGEISQRVIEGVYYDNLSINGSKPEFGMFILTNYRILFVSQLSLVQHQMKGKEPDYDDVGNCNLPISVVDKLKQKKNEIMAECKDFRLVKFSFGVQTDAESAFRGIEQFLTVKQTHRFCFFNLELAEAKKEKRLTSDVYSLPTEFERFCQKFHSLSSHWRITDCNRDYGVCSTYPKLFVVPSSLVDADVVKAAEHRSKGRIPILSYVHQNGATITRCAQPLTGLKDKKSKADIKFGAALVNATPHSEGLHIMDARPKLNAKANGAVGGGHENTSHYGKATTLKFLDIENIHAMRNCLNSLKDTCLSNSTASQWLTSVDNSQCLTHVKIILDGTIQIVELVEKGGAVLVHCSDGWDRTAQLCGLASLILDPYYRTIDGFIVSIEKEWLQVGHKFNDRIGQDNQVSRDERSPVFLQFVDCVWQMTQQYPTAFEFNESLLLDMLAALYSCRFGTFLFNCEKEREDNRVRETTPSFWEYVQDNRTSYTNLCYDPPIAGHGGTTLQTGVPTVLRVSSSMKDIRLWHNYYMQYACRGKASLDVMLQNEIRRLRGILKEKYDYEDEKQDTQPDILRSSVNIAPSGGSGVPPPNVIPSGMPATIKAEKSSDSLPTWGSVRPRAKRQDSLPVDSPSKDRRKVGGSAIVRPAGGDQHRQMARNAPPPLVTKSKSKHASIRDDGDDRETVVVTGGSSLTSSQGIDLPDEGDEMRASGWVGVRKKKSVDLVKKAEVVYAWKARDDNELTVEVGEVVEITRMTNENWWFVTKVSDPSANGHVPSTYVKMLDR